MPRSTLGTYCVGTEPPTTRDTNSKPEPRGSGSNSTWQTANWPCPPDCLTCRPMTRPAVAMVARSGTRTSSVVTSAPAARSRESTTSACASPIVHSTVWWVSTLRSKRSVGSAATTRVNALTSASSAPRVVRHDRDRQQRLRQLPAGEQQRIGGVGDGVAGLGAGQLRQRAQVARDARVDVAQVGAERRVEVRDALVLVVPVRQLVAAALGRDDPVVAADVHRGVGPQGAGEDPHQRDPADVGVGGGVHHLGGQRPVRIGGQRAAVVLPSMPVTAGSGRSSGDGNPPASTSSSASSPVPLLAQTGMTGWNPPRATAVSRSSTSVA